MVTRPGARPVDLSAVTEPLGRIGLVVAGSAELTDERLSGVGLVDADVPLVLSSQPAQLAAMESLVLFGRNTAWFGTLDGAAIAEQGVPAFTRTLTSVAQQVNLARGPLNVSWPRRPSPPPSSGRRPPPTGSRCSGPVRAPSSWASAWSSRPGCAAASSSSGSFSAAAGPAPAS